MAGSGFGLSSAEGGSRPKTCGKKEPSPDEIMDRSIIHLNIADFAVAVERAIDCRLKDRPVIIAPEGAVRAAVYDMSQEAYLAGIRKGMTLRKAARLCKDAWILPPHPYRYEQAMRAVLKQALPYSPLIETGEDDGHLFMDVGGTRRLFGPPMDIAWLCLNSAPNWQLFPIQLRKVSELCSRFYLLTSGNMPTRPARKLKRQDDYPNHVERFLWFDPSCKVLQSALDDRVSGILDFHL